MPSPDRWKPPTDLLVVVVDEDCVVDEPEVEAEIEVVVAPLKEEVDGDIDDEVDKGLEDVVDVENAVE
jgi:hypothetical protein